MGSVLLGLGMQCLPTLQGQPRLGHRWPRVSRPHLQHYAAVPRRQGQRRVKRTHATAAGISDVASNLSSTHKLLLFNGRRLAQYTSVSYLVLLTFLVWLLRAGHGLV